MDSILVELKTRFPGREKQITQLYNLFAYADEPFVDSVYIYGGPSVGKSDVISRVFSSLQVKYAVINLIECYTSKILFESILNKVAGHRLDPNNGLPYARCDNMMEFIAHLQKMHKEKNLNGFVLIVDKAERLRDMDSNLLPAFLRFKELTEIDISVVLLSEIIFEKYTAKTNIVEPIKIHFPQYNKDELLEILARDVDYVRAFIMNNSPEVFEISPDFFRNYLNVFLSVFYRACRDLCELRHMARLNFLEYCRPIISKECSAADSLVLWRHVAPVLKSSLEVLYLRTTLDDKNTQAAEKPFSKENIAQSLELPFYAKYLLIAAYLASYNPAKDDKRLFMKHHGKKKKTKGDVKVKSKVSEQLNTQLGPKAFTFDRLLAIFYAILDDKVGFNNNLLVQVSSLVELQLLSTLSDNCSLEGHKYKCNVNYDFMQTVSRNVGFNIRKYLSDFSFI